MHKHRLQGFSPQTVALTTEAIGKYATGVAAKSASNLNNHSYGFNSDLLGHLGAG